ncbi:phospho-sugar mutase [Entomospira culicis]|uniref:Phospho-sugar mutase n=1 Tax=Entomospira culicis TaxID=2719989 RepID=A0A968GJL9_9SPIO|nr:phospho-sugar mutase [Entomospira culicis]NIZ18840.1 phospho-sugar mutase [Entomospira culicis]NIZ69055.1 phospho-sugar mutase [Entomospira culicis]WDI37643.1 phospho-sugar mutase [Entomospira culicis]WDI39271.1 phospho-sugar mutase [Entomospira culicis]
MMSTDLEKRVQFYVEHEHDPHFLALAKKLQQENKPAQLEELFAGSIQFGTGGLRGIMQPGFTTINPLTIHLVSLGIGQYVTSLNHNPPRVVVSYDTRLYSREFAITAAQTFATLGMHVEIFAQPTPVPLLSYAIRTLKADFGVMITASHNPKEYNGYKVYWNGGEQVVSPHDKAMEMAIQKAQPRALLSETEAQETGLWHWLDTEILHQYQTAIAEQPIILAVNALLKTPITNRICYSPLHGSGREPVRYLLEQAGFNVVMPQAQMQYDGNFPSVKTPNPEDAENLQMAITLAKEQDASLVLATDPDADRLGVAVRHQGQFITLTGNQIGVLALHFIIDIEKKANTLPKNALFINTVVTSPLQNKIAKAHHVTEKRVLTGFKHIAEVIAQSEAKQSHTYLFGCEESYGYLIHPLARDKDAVSMALLVALMQEYYTQQGQTLIDTLEQLYLTYGYHRDQQLSYTFKGLSGVKAMQQMMDAIAEHSPVWSQESPLKAIYNYRTQKVYHPDGTEIPRKETLPKTNLLQFELEDETLISARPSGTEPKIKFYISIVARDSSTATTKASAIVSSIEAFIQPYLATT